MKGNVYKIVGSDDLLKIGEIGKRSKIQLRKQNFKCAFFNFGYFMNVTPIIFSRKQCARSWKTFEIPFILPYTYSKLFENFKNKNWKH